MFPYRGSKALRYGSGHGSKPLRKTFCKPFRNTPCANKHYARYGVCSDGGVERLYNGLCERASGGSCPKLQKNHIRTLDKYDIIL